MYSFLHSTGVPVRVSINKLYLVPNRIMAGLVCVLRKAEGWVRASRISLLCSLILSCIDLPVTTSVYRKPTHTDQYLAYDAPSPQPVKRGIVKCLYDQANRLVTKPSVISEEEKHLSFVLVPNGYPSSFVQKITKTRAAESPWQSLNPPPFYPMYSEYGASSPLPRTIR